MIHLYSGSRCLFSHRVRVVLHKKDMDFKVIDVNINMRQDLMMLNPHNEAPILVDDIDKNNKKKDLVLIDTNIMSEYIDERFPHPQLMPIEPSEKARLRMMLSHLDRELATHIRVLEKQANSKDTKVSKKEIEKHKMQISAKLDSIAQIFITNKKAEYLFGNSFSLFDATILPLLWRLKHYGIAVKPSWAGMMKYANTQFATPEFIASLTPAERGMANA